MSQTTLTASLRTATGKGAARTLRREGQVPAVIYGHGRPAEPLSVDVGPLTRYFASRDRSAVIEVEIPGRDRVRAILREVQRNPIRPTDILHIDLYEIHADEALTLEVPVRLIGVPDGVRNFGGVLDHVLRELEIKVLPRNIPEHLDLDVSGLGIGQGLHIRDVKQPEIEFLQDEDLLICTVVAPRVEDASKTAEEEAPTGAEPELIRKPKTEDEDDSEE